MDRSTISKASQQVQQDLQNVPGNAFPMQGQPAAFAHDRFDVGYHVHCILFVWISPCSHLFIQTDQ
jgi:hypothetical protein